MRQLRQARPQQTDLLRVSCIYDAHVCSRVCSRVVRLLRRCSFLQRRYLCWLSSMSCHMVSCVVRLLRICSFLQWCYLCCLSSMSCRMVSCGIVWRVCIPCASDGTRSISDVTGGIMNYTERTSASCGFISISRRGCRCLRNSDNALQLQPRQHSHLCRVQVFEPGMYEIVHTGGTALGPNVPRQIWNERMQIQPVYRVSTAEIGEQLHEFQHGEILKIVHALHLR